MSTEPEKTISTTVRGTEMHLLASSRALELCARMNRETEVLDFIDEMQPGSVMYDLGACEGRFSIYASLRGVKSYAFEPEALNFQALTENIRLNGEKTAQFLRPFNYAVGDHDHVSAIKIAQPWAGGHQRVVAEAVRSDLAFDFTQEQKINVTALDSFIASQNLPKPDYLKVDVDGSEMLFVKGAMQTLASPSLRGVMFELFEGDQSYQQVLDALARCGQTPVARHKVEDGLYNVWFRRA